jgi:hypothetical protein
VPTESLPSPPPRRSPVSAAITLNVEDSVVRDALERALRAVDFVHDDGTLPSIAVTANPKLKSTLARYQLQKVRAIGIEINPGAPGTAFNMLEEIAHFIDHQALGTDGWGFASKNDASLGRLRTALLKSAPVRKLLKLAKGAKNSVGRRLREAAEIREIFARAYSQYIATKCGDPVLLAGLDSDRNSGFGDILHWNDAEFRGIMEAFDQLFAEKHWT